MRTGSRARLAVVAAAAVLLAAGPAAARLGRWVNVACETPQTYYSAAHLPNGHPMCCPNADLPSVGVCPGGAPCPAGGQCPTGESCLPFDDPRTDLPNIVVIYSDDQPYCGYGFMGGCRTDKTGTPVPGPYTPALDDLATHGKVFTVAHNVAPWCLPSRDAVITGRQMPQRGCSVGACKPPGARPDGSSSGLPTTAQLVSRATPGYCSYFVGKGLSKIGFDAVKASRRTGRTPCSRCNAILASQVDPVNCQFDPAQCPDPADSNNPACNTAPKCGLDDPTQVPGVEIASDGEVDQFLDDLIATGTDGKHYLPKKFMVWFAPAMPHLPVAPADVIEHRPHSLSLAPPDVCKDFLFGYLCDQPNPPTIRVLGPRFPFGGPAYAANFSQVPHSKMQGFYGNVFWMDTAIQRTRKLLAARSVETATGPRPLSADTVIMMMSDNGAFLPRSKKKFTENGYRSPLIVYDPRHPTAPGGENRIENDIAFSLDLLPTILSYAGASASKPAEVPGKDLRPAVENAATTRNALCNTGNRSVIGTTSRYILPRGGSIGQCSTPTNPPSPCLDDGGCGPGELCTGDGQCAVPGKKPCIDDDDCRVHPTDTPICSFQERKWCSGNPTQPCTTDAECRSSCRTCSGAPGRTCLVNSDCGSTGPCVAADPLACSCVPRRVKLYTDETGFRESLTDLVTDPDESTLVDASASTFATGTNAKLSHRLRCCLDKWWIPPGQQAESCPTGCDARVDCTL